jgi:hypothetical protein
MLFYTFGGRALPMSWDHRKSVQSGLRETSFNRFTPKAERSTVPQIEELLGASKVSAFFIDDDQIVGPGEIGSVNYIKQYAAKK